MTRTSFAALAFACLTAALLPTMASAQSSISGVVKDSSGAVVAGASVTASSEALIEKQRTVVTNGEGRYAIVDLRPGTYVVTVSQSGFTTMKQTIELPSDVTFPVDATLKVGAVGETVEVESRVATVDTENAAHPETLTRSDMDDLPTGRYMQSIASYTPGAHLNLPDIGGSQQIEQNYISVHGNGSVHDTYLLDNMIVNTTYSDGQIQQYIDNAAIQETTMQTSNVTAEISAGGMMTNLVPKDGGNAYHFQFFGGGSGGATPFWQGNNVDNNDGLRGVSGTDSIVKIEDFDGSFGGPIKKDKLWFMMTGRDQVTQTQAQGSFYPNGAPGIQDGLIYAGSFRLTYQINAKNKVSAFILRNWKYKGHEILDGGQVGLPADPSVASTQRNKWPMYYIFQSKWTGTPTAKLILEAGVSISHLDYNDLYQDGVASQAVSQTSDYDISLNKRYVAGFLQQYFQTTRNAFTAQGTYVTGSHQIKFGTVYSFGPAYYSGTMNGDGWNEFTNGAPLQFLAYDTPFAQRPKLDADIGTYVTDTWHYKRLAVTAGIRFEYLSAEIQPENTPAGRFVGARSIPDINCSNNKGMGCWKDWTPRIGGVYDVFGNHKTAIKAGFGKYNTQYSTSFTNNFNPMTTQTMSLAWNTTGLNPAIPGQNCAPVTLAGQVAPNPGCYAVGGTNGTSTAASSAPVGGLAGPTVPGFGLATTIPSLDPNFHREYNYQYNAGVQQELYKGVTLNANWYRRSNYQSVLLLNEAVGNSGWTQTSIINPLDGSTMPIFNLNNAIPTPLLYQTNSPQSLVNNVYTGYEASVFARLPRGAFVNFGYTIDRQLDRSCAETYGTNKLNDPNSLRYCDMTGSKTLTNGGINVSSLGLVQSPPWQNEFKVSGAYTLNVSSDRPMALRAGNGLVFSMSLYSNRYQGNFAGTGTVGGVNNGYLARTWTVSATTRYPADCAQCPNDPSGSTTTIGGKSFPLKAIVDPGLKQGSETLNLVAPGQVLTPRLNQVDLGVKKTFKFKEKYVLEPSLQAFNILNSNAPVTQSVAVSTTVSPFQTGSACTSGLSTCGVGGPITTITNPRLLRLALMFRF
ncbi:MAG TPA: carboxypeptidase regulatory-like domain-containing protein [Bryobacteraceae bacterium]|jgi:hypothetical protein|nr:carboxypeptidase regulatory-like domain-containing protein [Bryobacteraceae bacterium]